MKIKRKKGIERYKRLVELLALFYKKKIVTSTDLSYLFSGYSKSLISKRLNYLKYIGFRIGMIKVSRTKTLYYLK